LCQYDELRNEADKEYMPRIFDCINYTTNHPVTTVKFDKELYGMMGCKIKIEIPEIKLLAERNYRLPAGNLEYDYKAIHRPVYNYNRHFCDIKCSHFYCANPLTYICIVCGREDESCNCGDNLSSHIAKRFKSTRTIEITGIQMPFQQGSERLGLEIYLATLLQSRFVYNRCENDSVLYDSLKGVFFEFTTHPTREKHITIGEARIELSLYEALENLKRKNVQGAFCILLDILARYNILFEIATKQTTKYKNIFIPSYWAKDGNGISLKSLPTTNRQGAVPISERFRSFLARADKMLGLIGQELHLSRARTYISLIKLLYDALFYTIFIKAKCSKNKFMEFNVFGTSTSVYANINKKLAKQANIVDDVNCLRATLSDVSKISSCDFDDIVSSMYTITKKLKTYIFPLITQDERHDSKPRLLAKRI